MSKSSKKTSFFQDLWNRRFFQLLATYLGVTWGIIQFTEWLVSRYGLNESIVDKIALLLFACLPAVISLIYFHGRAGDDKWYTFEKIFYPINFLLALGASFFLVDGVAQSKTREIQVSSPGTDSLITRVVPKAEYTSRIVFFPFTSTLPQGDKWMEWGTPMLTDFDIEQNIQWYSVQPHSLIEEYEDYGYDIDKELPFSVKRKIAGDLYCDFFSTGKIISKNGSYQVDFQVVRTKDGEEVYQNNLQSETIYGLADQMSKAITENINKNNIDASLPQVDLPSRDLISGDIEVLKLFSNTYLNLKKDLTSGPQLLDDIKKAIDLDPLCAQCYGLQSSLLSIAGKSGMTSARKAVEHSQNLPERHQLRMKYYNYLHSQEPDKAKKLLIMWKDLYPQDVFPFYELIDRYKKVYNYNKAKEVAKEALEAGHVGTMLLTAANLFIADKKLDSAEIYIDKYEKLYPEKAKKKTLLGEVYAGKGDYAAAAKVYEQNTILNPGNIEAYINLAKANFFLLDLDSGMEAIDDGLKACKNYRDSLKVYNSMPQVYITFGMVDNSLATIDRIKEIYDKHYPPTSFFSTLLFKGATYSTINDDDNVKATLEEMKDLLPDFQASYLSPLLSYLETMWTDDKENYPDAWEKAKPLVKATSGETGVLSGELILHVYQKNWEEALKTSEDFLEAAGKASLTEYAPLVIDCFIELDKKEEGLQFLDNVLVTNPKHPLLLFSKFKLFMEFKEYNEAKKLVKDLEKAFSKSHARFEPKVEFEEYLTELAM